MFCLICRSKCLFASDLKIAFEMLSSDLHPKKVCAVQLPQSLDLKAWSLKAPCPLYLEFLGDCWHPFVRGSRLGFIGIYNLLIIKPASEGLKDRKSVV